MPLQNTSGNDTTDAYGGGVAVTPVYIEDVMSTYLYTGNGTSQTITNGIDLSTKGGLVWIKKRSASNNHMFFDTIRGADISLSSNITNGNTTWTDELTSFNTNGFTLGTDSNYDVNNPVGTTFASWTFRKQPKFFDVVTYTGNGISNRTVSHNLGSVPGCIIIKSTSFAQDWCVWHRGDGTNWVSDLSLNGTSAAGNIQPGSPQTSTTFNTTYVTNAAGQAPNSNGQTFVAYLFAHNAGGFGLTGTDNVISCGSFTTDGSGSATVNLGYEPQWLLFKNVTSADNWFLLDTMRGDSLTSYNYLLPNTSASETTFNSSTAYIAPNATGFSIGTSGLVASKTYIYIAIRRGPMKVPTDATKVFSPFTTAAATGTAVTTNFPVDFQLYKYRAGIDYFYAVDRLRGVNSTTTANSTPWLDTTATTAEVTATNVSRNWGNIGFEVPGIVGGASNVFYSYRRAPSFFDEVCSAGTGSTNQARTHNLGVTPELMIVKDRNSSGANWVVYSSTLGQNYYLNLNNTNNQQASTGVWGTSAFTATTFYCNDTASWCASVGNSGVFYLFATCAGVSKVGTYTGNGTTQAIACGFTGGARFVLIKCTSTTGGWYVYDTARGMTTLTDPYLLLNSTAAESATLGSVTTTTGGFTVNASILSAINTSSATYIFLAIA